MDNASYPEAGFVAKRCANPGKRAHVFGDGPERLAHTHWRSNASRTPSAINTTPVTGPADQRAIEVEPVQQDHLIGEHHQQQPQWRIAWTDKLWQSRGKDCASLRVEQIAQQPLPEGCPFTELRRLRSRCRRGGLLFPPEAGDQASQAEISQVCRPGE